MSVDCPDLLQSVQSVHAIANREADFRGVCARAYYAIYQDGKAFHDALKIPGSVTAESEGGKHADLIQQLLNPKIPKSEPEYSKSVSIGYMMQTLYANRIKADYKRDTHMDRITANTSVANAIKVYEKLCTGPSEPMKPQDPDAGTSGGRPTLTRIK